MNNDEILKHIQEMLKSDYFANNEAFQSFIKQSSIATSNIVQAVVGFYNSMITLFTDSLISLITDFVDFLTEQFNELIKESSADLSDVAPHIKHLALHSKKIRVRKKNYKRINKKQKIP